jgi:hypothetical protein
MRWLALVVIALLLLGFVAIWMLTPAAQSYLSGGAR